MQRKPELIHFGSLRIPATIDIAADHLADFRMIDHPGEAGAEAML